MDPTVISVETARELLKQITGKSESELLDHVANEGPPPLQYTEEGDPLYEETDQNRFITFMRPEKCVSSEEDSPF